MNELISVLLIMITLLFTFKAITFEEAKSGNERAIQFFCFVIFYPLVLGFTVYFVMTHFKLTELLINIGLI